MGNYNSDMEEVGLPQPRFPTSEEVSEDVSEDSEEASEEVSGGTEEAKPKTKKAHK